MGKCWADGEGEERARGKRRGGKAVVTDERKKTAERRARQRKRLRWTCERIAKNRGQKERRRRGAAAGRRRLGHSGKARSVERTAHGTRGEMKEDVPSNQARNAQTLRMPRASDRASRRPRRSQCQSSLGCAHGSALVGIRFLLSRLAAASKTASAFLMQSGCLRSRRLACPLVPRRPSAYGPWASPRRRIQTVMSALM